MEVYRLVSYAEVESLDDLTSSNAGDVAVDCPIERLVGHRSIGLVLAPAG